jgi:hypothetical protein
MKALALALLVLGLAVSATVVPGVFTTDDNNYLINVLALRQGRVTLANTEGLTPSRELLAFDPGPWTRAVTSTPVGSSAPPLYAVLALPFASFGWRGLVALNTVAYLAAIAMVFGYARRYGTAAVTPWLAAIAFGLGGFVIEYAQGVWPHAVSIALCTAGIVAGGRVVDWRNDDSSQAQLSAHLVPAATAGFLLALATGVRYQNAVVLAVVGGCVAVWAFDRSRTLIVYLLAAAVPLGASAFINHARLGSWNPISKGEGYLNVPVAAGSAGSLFDPLTMFWARLVDFSVRPPLVGPDFTWVTYEPGTGAHLMIGETVQKALLQSAPWAILALIVFVAAWVPRVSMPPSRRRQLQLISIVTIGVLVTFAFSGVRRHDGLVFNQRYLLELLPLAALGFAWSLDGLNVGVRHLIAGAMWGALAVVVTLRVIPVDAADGIQRAVWLGRHFAILKLPLLFAAILGAFWFLGRTRANARPWLAAASGLCLGWGLTIHLLDDVAASHRLRARKAAESASLDGVIPDHSALVAYTGYKDAVFPLLFTRDIVILDARGDEGADAPTLIRELLDRDRRVFVVRSGFTAEGLARVVDGWDVVRVESPGTDIVELRPTRH